MINVNCRRKEEVVLCIRYFCNTCGSIEIVAKVNRLLTGKVDRVMVFGTLTFVNLDYFKFTTTMAIVYIHYLSYWHLSLYGSFLISRIKKLLLHHDQVVSNFTMFVPDNVINKISLIVCHCCSQFIHKYVTRNSVCSYFVNRNP